MMTIYYVSNLHEYGNLDKIISIFWYSNEPFDMIPTKVKSQFCVIFSCWFRVYVRLLVHRLMCSSSYQLTVWGKNSRILTGNPRLRKMFLFRCPHIKPYVFMNTMFVMFYQCQLGSNRRGKNPPNIIVKWIDEFDKNIACSMHSIWYNVFLDSIR